MSEPADVVVCFMRCDACQCDSHFDPPQWHSWAEPEDIEHARKTGQPDPSSSRCGCACAKEATPVDTDETPLPTKPRPMVAEDFSTGAGPGITTLPMTEGEDGEHFGFGHINPAEFATAANAIATYLYEAPEVPWAEADVDHRWAVTTLAPEDGDGEWACSYVREGTEGAWPITVLIP